MSRPGRSVSDSKSCGPAGLGAAEVRAVLAAVLAEVPIGLLVVDADGTVITASAEAARLFGRRSAAALAGAPIGEHLRLPDDPAAPGGGSARLGRMMHLAGEPGEARFVDVHVAEATTGERTLYLVFIREPGAPPPLDEEVRQLRKLKELGELAGGIAHDFRNVLTVVIGNLQLLAADSGRDEKAVAEALEAATIGKALADRLLAFGRSRPLAPRETDVVAVVTEFVELLRRALGEPIRLVVGVRGEVRPAMVDASQLQSALLNLSLNARDAMPEGGRLSIDVEEVDVDADDAALCGDIHSGRYVSIAVADTGRGMPPDVRTRAFEPFFTTKRDGSGTGLGLSMVDGFARHSGGHVQICSEVGEGTTVRLCLPSATPSAGPEAPPAGHGETVLVVESDARIRRIASKALGSLGYAVLQADDAAAALATAEGADVDLLFTGAVLGRGIDGLALAGHLRERRPRLPVLVSSASAAPEVHAAGGRTGWLRKPYMRRELAGAVRHLLDDAPD